MALSSLAKLGGKVSIAIPGASKHVGKAADVAKASKNASKAADAAKALAKSRAAKKAAKATVVTGAVGGVATGVYMNSRDNGGIIGTLGPTFDDLNPINLVPKNIRDAGDAMKFVINNAVPIAAGVGTSYLYFTVLDSDILGAVGAGVVVSVGTSMVF